MHQPFIRQWGSNGATITKQQKILILLLIKDVGVLLLITMIYLMP